MNFRRMSLAWIAFILLLGSNATADTVNYTYDNAGRLIQVEYSDGSVIEYTYDSVGNRVSMTVHASETAPEANFSGTPTSGPAPLVVAFTDGSAGSIDSRAWSFGDGGTANEKNPTHTYYAPGTYSVSLTVSGPGGTDTEMKKDYIVVTAPPVTVKADFSANPTSGAAELEVRFTDASTGEISSWAWDFGDGGTSGERNPTHTYTALGTYNVTLTVGGPNGSDTEIKEDFITVSVSQGGEARLCSKLGLGWLLDIDVFAFKGKAGEKVAITFDPSGSYKGSRVRLLLSGPGTLVSKRVTLPYELAVTLKRTGEYHITIAEELFGRSEFNGGYCLTLQSSQQAYKSLVPTWWVEKR